MFQEMSQMPMALSLASMATNLRVLVKAVTMVTMTRAIVTAH